MLWWWKKKGKWVVEYKEDSVIFSSPKGAALEIKPMSGVLYVILSHSNNGKGGDNECPGIFTSTPTI